MIKALKHIFMYIRTSVKLLMLLLVAGCIIVGVTVVLYKQTYSVTLRR